MARLIPNSISPRHPLSKTRRLLLFWLRKRPAANPHATGAGGDLAVESARGKPHASTADSVLTVLFLVAIALPGGALLFSRTGQETTFEKRTLTPWPTPPITSQQLVSFPAQFEAAFADRFAGRQTMIQWHNFARLRWLGIPPATSDPRGTLASNAARSGAAKVLAGKDQWLFFTGDRVIDDYRCTRPFSADELRHWVQTIIERRNWLAERGIEYTVVFAPNKHTVYGEFLPSSVTRIGTHSRLDQLTDALLTDTPVTFVDLRAALFQAKNENRLYHRTDTHWNDVGALIGSRAVAAKLVERLEGTVALPAGSFNVSLRRTSGGDLAQMLGLAELLPEDRLEPQGLAIALTHSVPPRQNLAGVECRSYASAPVGNINALILHDSFGLAMMPFLSAQFHYVDYLHTYDFRYAQRVIEGLPPAERPKIVIQQYVERILQVHKPDEH
ncbi:MAG: hypothetical protein MPJ50_11850 [Pirellulales bacterium]|nr:hypothetical protein [Pirellulales bacterium]